MFRKENLELITDNIEHLTEVDTVEITKIALRLRSLNEHTKIVEENEKLESIVKLIRNNSEERLKINSRLTMLYDMGNECDFLSEELNKITGYYLEKQKTLQAISKELNNLLTELT